MTDHLLESVEDGVATLTMNRPDSRNALSAEMTQALGEALPRLALDSTVRTVVLTGTGKGFCSGGDVKAFAGPTDTPPTLEERNHSLRRGMEASRWLHEMPKPTLAVIPGATAGAGFSLAMACDMRIASDTAKLTTAFSNVGLSGDYGGSYFLTKLIGAAKTRELYFFADVLTGQEAYELGIVNRAVPADKLAEEARILARKLASRPTIALGYMKRNLNTALHATLSEVLDMESLHMGRTFETEDHAAAAKAFVEKRAPEFKGR